MGNYKVYEKDKELHTLGLLAQSQISYKFTLNETAALQAWCYHLLEKKVGLSNIVLRTKED